MFAPEDIPTGTSQGQKGERMSDVPDSVALIETGFHLDSVIPVADPTGGDGSWFRYVISQGVRGENTVTGTKSGSHAEVQVQLHQMVTRLNERFGKLQAKKR
ncbi:MAG: hypothetical protein HC872_07030 [Gammaproteobacteria bacterium]|nr:hypothetical protein [Gammaproteobacteria bacterium]